MKQTTYYLQFENETISVRASGPLSALLKVCSKRTHLAETLPELMEDEHGRMYDVNVSVKRLTEVYN